MISEFLEGFVPQTKDELTRERMWIKQDQFTWENLGYYRPVESPTDFNCSHGK